MQLLQECCNPEAIGGDIIISLQLFPSQALPGVVLQVTTPNTRGGSYDTALTMVPGRLKLLEPLLLSQVHEVCIPLHLVAQTRTAVTLGTTPKYSKIDLNGEEMSHPSPQCGPELNTRRL